MEVIHVPSGGVEINGVVYVASGPGPHPTFVLFHGLPGNEKNLDLAQAVRRAGWNAVTINYRGSWGSPGKFSFGQNLEDAQAVLAYVRDPANAAKLGIDPSRIAIGGHSMGGWVAAETAAKDKALLGTVIFSAADMAQFGQRAKSNRPAIVAVMAGNRETLAASADEMVDELLAHADEWTFTALAPNLVDTRLYVLYSKDLVAAHSVALVKEIKAGGGRMLQAKQVATDHGWSDKRIELETLVIDWLQGLPTK
jgi:pimeloyl-ACP methyl ester carboxylesterase